MIFQGKPSLLSYWSSNLVCSFPVCLLEGIECMMFGSASRMDAFHGGNTRDEEVEDGRQSTRNKAKQICTSTSHCLSVNDAFPPGSLEHHRRSSNRPHGSGFGYETLNVALINFDLRPKYTICQKHNTNLESKQRDHQQQHHQHEHRKGAPFPRRHWSCGRW